MFVSKIIKERNYWKVAIIGIIIATFFWFNFFSKRLSPKIKEYAKNEADKHVYLLLSDVISQDIKNNNSKELIITSKNEENEIILTEYNLKKLYELLSRVNESLSKKLDKDFYFFLPSGLYSKSFLINTWGSKIPIRVIIAGNIYSNIKTKITNYGLNNALVEVYIIVKVNQRLLSPMADNDYSGEYEILVSTFFINGKVPNFYGDSYELSSNIFDINKKI